MEGKLILKETYELESKHGAFYTGGTVQWLSDGSKLFCQEGSSVNVLDVANGQITSTLQTERENTADTILTFTLNSNEETVVTAHKSGLIRLWNWSDGSLIQTWRSVHAGPVSRLALRDSILASGGTDSGVRIWDILSKICTCSLRGLSGVVSVLEFRPKVKGVENTIFGAADDTSICCWNIESGEKVSTFSGHYSRIMALVFARDEVHMVSAGRDRVLILWDLNTNVALRTLPAFEALEGLVLLPPRFKLPGIVDDIDTGVNVASVGSRGVIRVWDMLTSKERYVQQNSMVPEAAEGMRAITHLLFSERAGTFASVAADHNIYVHQLDTFACKKQLVGFNNEILDVALLGKDESHLAVASNSNDIRLYELQNMNCQLLQGHTNLVMGVSTSPADPNLLLSSSKDQTVHVWLLDPATGSASCVSVATGHKGAVGAVALGRLVADKFASVSEDRCLKLWKWSATKGAQVVKTVGAHTEAINAVAFSDNDKMIATASQDKTVGLWNGTTLALQGRLKGHRRGVWSVAFAPIQQLLASASADMTLRIWSVKKRTCVKALHGHGSAALRVVFLSRGLQLASCSGDGLIKLWTLATGNCDQTMANQGHGARIWAMTVTQDEKHIITGGSDSQLVLWKDVTVEKKALEAEESRILIEQEQLLSNLIQQDNLLEALRMSLTLQRPSNALAIIRKALKSGDTTRLSVIVSDLRDDQKQVLLGFVTTWNTNSRNCYIAQVILSMLMDDLSLGTIPIVANTVEDSLPYTDRHFKRLTRLLQDVHLLEYTVVLSRPDLAPQVGLKEEPNEDADVLEDMAILGQADFSHDDSASASTKKALKKKKQKPTKGPKKIGEISGKKATNGLTKVKKKNSNKNARKVILRSKSIQMS